jgi:hypothetical protein
MIFDLNEFAITGLCRGAENRAVINPRMPGNDAIGFTGLEDDSWE